MYELEDLIKQIEELRLSMIKIKEGKSYTDLEVIAASQELDVALDKYQETTRKNKANMGFCTQIVQKFGSVD